MTDDLYDPGDGVGGFSGFMLDHGFAVIAVLAVLGFTFVIAMAVRAARRDRARQAELAGWAADDGWQLVDSDPRWVTAFEGAPFGVGSKRRAQEVCTKDVDGRQHVAYTYRWTTTETVTTTNADGTTSTRQQEQDHYAKVLGVQLPVPLGSVQIVRETLGHRLVTTFGGQDIEIEHADFNRRYRVTAADPKLAVDLLNPRTVERLLQHRDASLRLVGDWVVCFEPGRLEPFFVQERARLVADLLAGVPRFVWLDHGFTPPG